MICLGPLELNIEEEDDPPKPPPFCESMLGRGFQLGFISLARISPLEWKIRLVVVEKAVFAWKKTDGVYGYAMCVWSRRRD